MEINTPRIHLINKVIMMNKSILEVVHEGAKDLHKAGLLNEMTMKELDVLCLPPVKILIGKQIQKIRGCEHVSQY